MTVLRRSLIALLTIISLNSINADDKPALAEGLYAKITTNKGIITARLFYKKVPLTVANFVGLAEGAIEHNRGKKKPFYDGLKFHRVINDFMIQTGCPDGTGMGGPGYAFKDEFDPTLKHSKGGILSMANGGPGTNGSQFFITHKETPHLDNRHSVFGEVVDGMDVVNAIAKGDVIKSVKIMRVGKDAKAFKVDDKTFKKKIGAVKLTAEETVAMIKQAHPKLTETKDGMMTETLKEGEGDGIESGDLVTFHCAGGQYGGRPITDTRRMRRPFSFILGSENIPLRGWSKGLVGAKKGEKRLMIIPPELGFGEGGLPQARIPGGAYLSFEAEVLDVTPKATIDKEKAEAKKAAEETIKKQFPKAVAAKEGYSYVLTAEGKGDSPKKGQRVHMHYTGKLLDGTVFDSSHRRKQPFPFILGSGQVIKGWDLAIQDMKIGGKRTLILPPDLAYGYAGRPPVIPKLSYLIFEVELVEIK